MTADRVIPAGCAGLLLAGAATLPSPLGAMLAVPALLLVPGGAWVWALRLRTGWSPGPSEAITLTITLSLLSLALGGVLLSELAIALTTASWALLVAALTTPALLLAITAATGDRRQPAMPRPTRAATLAALVAAGCVAAAVAVTLSSEASERRPLTELGVRETTGSERPLLAITVRNREQRDLAYTLRISTPAGEVARHRRRIAAGGLWTQRVDVGARRLRAMALVVQLFRDDRPRVPYREARVAPDRSAAPPCRRAAASAPRSCLAGDALATVVPAGASLQISGLRARVLGTRVVRGQLVVRVRVRNASTERRRIDSRGPLRLASGVDGPQRTRTNARVIAGPAVLASRATAVYRLTFGPDAATARALRRGRAGLVVAPDHEAPYPSIGFLSLSSVPIAPSPKRMAP